MLAILSPAKKLDTTAHGHSARSTRPQFEAETETLLGIMKQQSRADLRQLMGISENLAQLNHDRYVEMTVPVAEDSLPAALLFAGDVYRGLDARSLGPDALSWAQEHLIILSGLYGLLRPLDRTHPYRLEMGTRLTNPRGPSLYAFWGSKLSEYLDTQLQQHDDAAVVDLASGEYARAVDRKALRADWITVAFKEIRDGKPRVISFFAKNARGRMARWMIDNRIAHRDQLRTFAEDGYAYAPSLSSEASLVFTRSSSA